MSYNSMKIVGQHVPPGLTYLDVGCGPPGKRPYRPLRYKEVVNLDACAEYRPKVVLDFSVENLPFKENSFDVVLFLDVIEHLEKKRGFIILDQCKRIARRWVFLLTPLWWEDHKEAAKKNPYQLHLSKWTYADFKNDSGWLWFCEHEIFKDYLFGRWEK